jgi:hypothetical protein
MIKVQILNDDSTVITTKVDENYILPIASATILGGVKVGKHLSITQDGIIDTIFNIDDAISSDSVNPVQNKVLAAALAAKQDKLDYTLTYDDINL